MMRVRWLRKARGHLGSIGRYIARNNPQAAIETVQRIYTAAERLVDQPLMGRSGRVMGTRELVVTGTPYIVAYRVRGSTVEVLAVLHSSQQWPIRF